MILIAQEYNCRPYLVKKGDRKDLEDILDIEHYRLRLEGWDLVYVSKNSTLIDGDIWLWKKENQTIMTRLAQNLRIKD